MNTKGRKSRRKVSTSSGLTPYQYYSAGIACYLSDIRLQQDAWDIWDNHAPITGVKNGISSDINILVSEV